MQTEAAGCRNSAALRTNLGALGAGAAGGVARMLGQLEAGGW